MIWQLIYDLTTYSSFDNLFLIWQLIHDLTSYSWFDNLFMIWQLIHDLTTYSWFDNFITQDMVNRISEVNKVEREMNKVPTVHADVSVAHNYSTQTLNSTELAKEKLRQILAEVTAVLVYYLVYHYMAEVWSRLGF